MSLVLGLIQTHNPLIFGLTTKPSRLGAWQEDSGLPKLLKWIVSIVQALRMTDAEANFYFMFLIRNTLRETDVTFWKLLGIVALVM